MKRTLAFLAALLLLSVTACAGNSSESAVTGTVSTTIASTTATTATTTNTPESFACTEWADKTPEAICAQLSLEEKAAQMVQAAVYSLSTAEMKANCYGSLLSLKGTLDDAGWRNLVDTFQRSALQSETGIPYLYGQDDVHGVNYCANAVFFPHNIGIGAANDAELTYQMGLAVADEAKLCHMLWNFAPCVAQSADPRWGRTYESYGSDLDMITTLSTAFTKGLVEGGIIACPKHFFADGNVAYGTGENSDVERLIDRGDARLTDAEIDALLAVYQAQIDAGAQTIMISHSAVNGVKMHENATYIQKIKQEMGFTGFIVSDWNSVQNTSPKTYEEQVIVAVNAGIDMLMEVDTFEEARQIIIRAVGDGRISQTRVDDAVTRIIKVKQDTNLFADPLGQSAQTTQSKAGSADYRALAEKLVEKSLVLLKNDNNVLPLKAGTRIYVTGPAADHAQAQCGGWTLRWNQSPSRNITGVTTILNGLQQKAAAAGITILTDKKDAASADVVLLVVGEQAYAEWNGDTADLSLCGALGLDGNAEAIAEAKALQKPTVCCVVAGRQVLLGDAYADWDSVVMCYLPGSEGQGVANVLYGSTAFQGKLPSPWYASTAQIGTDECWLQKGYGLTIPTS